MVPATESEITACEARVGFRLPDVLRELFLSGQAPLISDDALGFKLGLRIVLVSAYLSLRGSRGGLAMHCHREVVLGRQLDPHLFPFANDPVGNVLVVDCATHAAEVLLVLGEDEPGSDVIPLGVGLKRFLSELTVATFSEGWLATGEARSTSGCQLEMDAPLREIRRLVDVSGGQVIELSGAGRCSFRQLKRLSSTQIDARESALGVTFPSYFRSLLTEVGVADCFVDDVGRAALEIYDPADVGDLFEDFFEDPSEIRRCLPIGCNQRLQEILVLLLSRPESEQLLVVSHEVPPEDWESLAAEIGPTSLDSWLRHLLSTGGRPRPH